MVRLRSRSRIIDSQAVACEDNGIASFDRIRHHRQMPAVFLFAFDLIELKRPAARSARGPQGHACKYAGKAGSGIRFNEQLEGDGPTVFAHACKLGLEGIVSKRKDSS